MGVEGMGQGGAAGPGGSAAMSGATPSMGVSNLMMPLGTPPNAGMGMPQSNPMMTMGANPGGSMQPQPPSNPITPPVTAYTQVAGAGNAPGDWNHTLAEYNPATRFQHPAPHSLHPMAMNALGLR